MKESRILDAQKAVYRPAFMEHGDSPKGTRHNNEETQSLRFEMITAHLLNDKEHNTIEDIGCGLCDLYGFLKKKKYKFTYSGTEIVEEMIEFTKQKYPELTICNRDILKKDCSEKYDFVVLSGTLYIPGEVSREEWKEFCFSLIRKMYDMCNKAIAFNFLTTHRTFTDPELFYLDPAEAIDYCLSNLSRFVELKHNYPLYEGTITVYKESYIQEKYRNPVFAKYFQPAK